MKMARLWKLILIYIMITKVIGPIPPSIIFTPELEELEKWSWRTCGPPCPLSGASYPIAILAPQSSPFIDRLIDELMLSESETIVFKSMHEMAQNFGMTFQPISCRSFPERKVEIVVSR